MPDDNDGIPEGPRPEGWSDRDENNFRVLIRQLRDQNSTFRWKAAEALGKARDPRAVGPLVALLKDPERDVQWIAAMALGKIGDPAAAFSLSSIKPLLSSSAVQRVTLPVSMA